jgi:hypothetical protein
MKSLKIILFDVPFTEIGQYLAQLAHLKIGALEEGTQ